MSLFVQTTKCSKITISSYYWQQKHSVCALNFEVLSGEIFFSSSHPFSTYPHTFPLLTSFFLPYSLHLLFFLCLSFALIIFVLSPCPPSALSFPLLSAVEAFEEVSDSLCVPQYNTDGEERVILFLKMAPGKPFCPELVAKIKGAIRKALSARHVPALLLETRDIPVREIWTSIKYE